MPGSPTTPGRTGARDIAPVRVAFRNENGVGTRNSSSFAAQWLAYAYPYRRFTVALASDGARLGADVDRYSFTAVDLHHLLPAGLPAHSHRTVERRTLSLAARLRHPVLLPTRPVPKRPHESRMQACTLLAIPAENAHRKGTDGKRISPRSFPEHRFEPLRFVTRQNGPSLLMVDVLHRFRRAADRARERGEGLNCGSDLSAHTAGEDAEAARCRPAAERWSAQLPRSVDLALTGRGQ